MNKVFSMQYFLQPYNRVEHATFALQKLFNELDDYKQQDTDLHAIIADMKSFEFGILNGHPVFTGSKKCCNTKFIMHGKFTDIKNCVCKFLPKAHSLALIMVSPSMASLGFDAEFAQKIQSSV